MSYFDPYNVSTRLNSSSFRGQVIRQRPVDYNTINVSADKIPKIVDYLKGNGYTIYPPLVPNYPDTEAIIYGRGWDIQDRLTKTVTTGNEIDYYTCTIKTILDAIPPWELKAITDTPFPPKSFYCEFVVDTLCSTLFRASTNGLENRINWKYWSAKFTEFESFTTTAGGNPMLSEYTSIMECTPGLCVITAGTSGSLTNYFTSTSSEAAEAFHSIGSFDTNLPTVDPMTVYNYIKDNNQEFLAFPLFTINVESLLNDATITNTQLKVHYHYLLRVRY